MSRRSQTTREADTGGIAEPVVEEEVFTWNAMLISTLSDTVNPNETVFLTTDWPLHKIADEDFSSDSPPALRIVIPRDGVYSVSARVSVSAPAGILGLAGLNAHTSSYAGTVIDSEMRPLSFFDAGLDRAWLGVSHAGWPFVAGDHVWIAGENRADLSVDMHVESFSVTYEAELGVITPPFGG